MKHIPAHASTITAAATIVTIVAIIAICPPDRVEPILEWFRILAEAVGSLLP